MRTGEYFAPAPGAGRRESFRKESGPAAGRRRTGGERRFGRGRAGGFGYLAALFLVLLMGLALAGTGQLWSTLSRRDKEKEALWVGTQYAKALRSYYRRSPGRKEYPAHLGQLIDDRRFPTPQHHLRRLYADPISGGEWGLVRTPEGRIAGVFSRSAQKPLKQANFPLAWEEFAHQDSYSAWRFVADEALRSEKRPPAEDSPPRIPPEAGQ